MATLTTSIPAVVDALLVLWRALNLVDATGSPISIFDGYPGPQLPDTFVQVGGIDQLTADGSQDWASLGVTNLIAPARDERYAIDCAVTSYMGGVDAGVTGTSDAQKTARDNAFTVLTALETAVRGDPKLGSTLGTGWISFGERVSLSQTTPEDPEAGKGRTATFLFSVDVYHRLYS